MKEAQLSPYAPILNRLRMAEIELIVASLFDAKWYLATNPDIAALGEDAFGHYVHVGATEGRSPHPLFDVPWYLAQHPDLAERGGNPVLHLLSGDGGWQDPNPLFNAAWYASTYSEALEPNLHPLLDYIGRSGEGRDPNPLFDAAWYTRVYGVALDAGQTPLTDYLLRGFAESRNPNPIFDAAWYLRTYTDVAAAGQDPLAHFLRSGSAEGRRPNPLFDTSWYLTTYPEVAAAGENPLSHYLRHDDSHNPNPLFDTAWYLRTYPEVEVAGENPLHHYQRHFLDGYRPNPVFNGLWYLRTYPFVAVSGVEPLEHFIHAGAAEGRCPDPLFDTSWYLKTYPEVVAAGENALTHYLSHMGSHDPNPLFDTAWYLRTYPEAEAGESPLEHYLRHYRGSCNPNAVFDPRWYLRTYPEVENAGVEPLEHFLHAGSKLGWQASPDFDPYFYGAQVGLETRNQIELFAHYLRSRPAGRILRTIMDAEPAKLQTALGSNLEIKSGTRLTIGIVAGSTDERRDRRVLTSARISLSHCRPEVDGRILLLNAGAGVDAHLSPATRKVPLLGRDHLGAGHNRLCAEAFGSGADVYIGADARGAFHPDCIAALLRMNQAQRGKALIGAIQFPEEFPCFHHPETLESAWISRACFLLPASVWRATGGFIDSFDSPWADMDLSFSAAASGFRVRLCQTALFHCGSAEHGPALADRLSTLLGARHLGHKWSWAELRLWAEAKIEEEGLANRDDLPRLDETGRASGVPARSRLFEALACAGLRP